MSAQDILKLVLHWSGYGEEGAVSFHFQSAGSHSDALLNNAVGNIDTQWGSDTAPSTWTQLTALLSQNQAYDELTLYQYDALPGKVSNIGRKAINHQGTASGTLTPLQSCMVVGLKTAISSASTRGRVYMPAHTIPESNATALFASGQATAMATLVAKALTTAGAALAGTLNASSALSPVVYSPTKAFVTPVTAVTADNKPDIQRRRANKLQPTATASIPFSQPS